MIDLAAKLRKAREFRHEIEGLKLICLRPTQADMVQLEREGWSGVQVAEAYVIGWEGVTEADLVPSGASDAVPFNQALWREYLRDHHELWPIAKVIKDDFWEKNEALKEREKN